MKANFVNMPVGTPLPYVESDIKLTISLLVSNRMDTIRKCLDSIKPLLDSISSELIAVDTVGEENSDGSLAVAREYTDNIIHFDWCDDFAAARNAGLKRAKGEWFMYIDDDEWFEDISEIIEFFQSGECDSYGKAVYQVRNYVRLEEGDILSYSTTAGQRMTRLTSETRFVSKVHEYLWPMHEPEKIFFSYVHHYGYYYKTEEDGWEHFKRNTNLLLQELKKNPNNFHAALQIAQEYESVGKYDEMEKYCRESLAKDRIPTKEKTWFLMALPRSLFFNHHVEEAIEEGEKILEEEKLNELSRLNLYITLSDAYATSKRPEEALNYAKKYIKGLDYFDRHPELVNKQKVLGSGDAVGDPVRLNLTRNITAYSQVLNQYENLAEFLLQCPWEKECLQQENKLILAVIDTARKTNNYCLITEIFTRMLNQDSCLPNPCKAIVMHYNISEDNEKSYFWKALADIPGKDAVIAFSKVMALRQSGGEELKQAMEDCVNRGITCAVPYQDLLLVCLENSYNPAPFLCSMYTDEWIQCVEIVLHERKPEELIDLLMRSTSLIKPVDEMKYLYFTMRIQGVLVVDETLSGEVLLEQLFKWSKAALAYSRSLYHPSLFEDITTLPRETRCALCLEKAEQEKQTGNIAPCLTWLRKALVDYPPMKPFVEKIVIWITEQQEEVHKEQKEFQELARKIKTQIRIMVNEEQKTQAALLLTQLKTLLPNDKEIIELEVLMNQ